MLTNRYVIAVLVPIVLILCGALAKKLVRGSAWVRTDFFLGVELSLAAMAAGLINTLDLARVAASESTPKTTNSSVAANGVFLAICFFLLLWVLAIHQDWEKRPHNKSGQIAWLGGFCNLVGFGLMLIFILLVKGT